MERPSFTDKQQYTIGTEPNAGAQKPTVSGSESDSPVKVRPGRLVRIVKGWWQEALWCCLSFASFIALVAVLRAFDGQSLPKFPSGITLNTIVAFLSTVCKTAFIVPVAEGLAQSKWNWFKKKPRPLADFAAFDHAQSPVGSLKLILRTRQHLISMLAAFLLVTSISTATLTQSTVTYVDRDVDISRDGIAVAHRLPYHYYVGAGFNTQCIVHPSYTILGALDLRYFSKELSRATYWPVLEDVPFREPHCGTSNCTWPRYNTLAICAETKSVSSQVIKRGGALWEGNFDARLPNGLNITLDGPGSWKEIISVATGPSLTRNGTQAKDAGIFTYFAMRADEFVEKMHAVEVNFHWCVNTYEAKIENGQLERKLLKSHTEVHRGNFDKIGNSWVNGQNTNLEDIRYLTTPEDPGTKYPADGMGTYAMPEILERSLDSVTRVSATVSTNSASDMLSQAYQDVRGKHHEDNTDEDNHLMDQEDYEKAWHESVKRFSENLANGMTNGLLQRLETEDELIAVKGTALRNQVFIEVRWPWIALLAGQCFFSVLLLVLVIVETASTDIDIIKSSTLAALFAISAEEKAELVRRHSGEESILGKDDHLLLPTGIGGELRKQDGKWVLGG